MPIARIRTSDPEAISFLAAKLADSGFQVLFAVPGEKLSDDVDLDITVTRSKRSPEALDNGIAVTSPEVAGEWTTPYHVEAPEISETGDPGDECTNLDIPWNDRELARILATGSKRVHVKSAEVEEHLTEEIAGAEVGVPAVLRIVEDAKPTIVSEPPVLRSGPKPVLHVLTRAKTLPRHAFRQRFASIAAIVILAVTAVFSLTLSGDRPNPTKEIGTPTTQANPVLAAPMPTVSVPTLRVAASDLVPAVAPIPSKPSLTLTKSEVPERRTAHTKHPARRPSRSRKQRPPVSDPEVIIRHFPATAEQ